MNQTAKRILSFILCLTMLVGLMPAFAVGTRAAETTTDPVEESTGVTTPEEETTEPAEDSGVSALAEDDGTVTIPGSTTAVENAYVLTGTVSNNGTYLIVNRNTAGDGYALLNNNGTVSAVQVSVVQSDEGPCISLNNASAVWTMTSNASNASFWDVKNGSHYLGHSGSARDGFNLTLDGTSESWSSNGSNLFFTYRFIGTGYCYLRYNNGWTLNNSSANVYFYAPDTANVTVPDVQYGVTVSANGTTDAYTAKYVTDATTLALTAPLWANPVGYENGADGGTYAWTSSNEAVATVSADGTLDFTGKGGTTTVRATYTWGEYQVWDEIVITAEPAGYKVQIVDTNDNSVDGTVTVKGDAAIEAGLQMNALVTFETSATESEKITGASVAWSVSDPAVASIGADGKLTFTGKEGVVTVTVTYTDPEGNECTDTLNVTVSKSQYFTPNDGTNDFPDYPNEGAVRIDKNAQAVGNFSETGVAKVELSMTGVPYSAGNEIDVVLMLDMSTSMSTTQVKASQDAAILALQAIVKNEDESFNANRVAVYSFCDKVTEVFPMQSVKKDTLEESQSALTTLENKIKNYIQYTTGYGGTDRRGGGTNYAAALGKCQSVLAAAKQEEIGKDRQQFCVFMSDGSPSTGFAYVNASSSSGYSVDDPNANLTDAQVGSKYGDKTEYYSHVMKNDGVTVYTVALHLDSSSDTNAIKLLKQISNDGTAATNDYSFLVDSDEDEGKLKDIFVSIVNAIKEAATNVTVTDKITDEYTLILDTPENVQLPAGTELSIDVLQYTLDSDKNRTGDPVVVESVKLTDTDKVTFDAAGNIAAIDADTFTYDAATHTFIWKAEKLDTTELALSYYIYLNHSAGYDVDEQTPAGTYPTNEFAHITYTNHLDNPCQKYFPKPQLTWNGAQVSYTFYLVNAQGQPVNRAGRVIPFAEAIYVTDVYTESVTWDTDADKMLDAEMIASELLPDVYELYDNDTAYTINVYEDDEGKDLGNHFVIIAGNSTTKVFNTKAGTIYSEPGTYNKDNVFAGFDFANTTVAFAVVWKNELAPDTVVIDFGLDVVIDVTTNDALEAKVVGVRTEAPAGVVPNSGTFDAAEAQEAAVKLGNTVVGTASVESLSSVRFSLDKDNGMQLSAPATFYYESEASYYNSSNALTTVDLYSAVTVIPATTVYYEDDFLELTSYTINRDENGAVVSTTKDDTNAWTQSASGDATQAQDRPGASQISAALDADNNYGFDKAYETMSTYSMNNAAKITVDANKRGEAAFTFYGTGFDVVGLTSNATGSLIVQIEQLDAVDAPYKNSLVVDTYYGMARADFAVTYTYTEWNRRWTETSAVKVDAAGTSDPIPENPADGDTYVAYEVRWTTSTNDPNALFQVPVMKMTGLPYGQYAVKIVAGYNSYFDHTATAGSYDLYLDAIRIYDPTGNKNDTANDAYKADGEAWPQYIELRNNIIAASNYAVTENADGTVTVTGNNLSGAIFIDCDDATTSIADYVSYGPNNELYLAPKQSVAFALDQTNAAIIADVQIALKLANGGAASYEMYKTGEGNAKVNTKTGILHTATDLYYSIKDLADGTIVITNTGDSGILSITNIKVTYTQDPAATESVMTTSLYVDETVATAALMSLRTVSVEEPEVTEPETEVTEPETEATEPETEATEPETEATEPETEPESGSNGSTVGTVIRIIKKLFGWLFG